LIYFRLFLAPKDVVGSKLQWLSYQVLKGIFWLDPWRSQKYYWIQELWERGKSRIKETLLNVFLGLKLLSKENFRCLTISRIALSFGPKKGGTPDSRINRITPFQKIKIFFSLKKEFLLLLLPKLQISHPSSYFPSSTSGEM